MELIQEADRSKWMVHSSHSIKRFTKGDIDRMTNNYRISIGSGAFGEVYKGILEDGSTVAVKRFIHNVKENFAKELIVHREINHENVVRLIGYCIEENALMLVTKYITNGNLNDALHQDSSPIPLGVRLRIAIECAEALAYMHSHMYTHVIHGDIKPANILLDDNFQAKLTDFGISRLANTDKTMYTENFTGSIGYMDPLFARDGLITSKSDVYSFGVVLFELITREKATTVVNNVDIVSAFTNALARGVRSVRQMFDAEIASKDDMKIVEGTAKIAGECLIMEREKRPRMIDVVERLRVLWKASQQDQGQRVDLFSWARKSKPVPAKILASGLCRQFSLAEMKAATNNFNELLLVGEGAYSRVYNVKINERETMVAIKRHRPESLRLRSKHEFRTEIVMSSKHIHHNVLPLLGYCDEMGEMILVYNYMAHGCLRDHLYGTRQPPLNWNQRLEICIGAARGLHCLHASKIIHGNVTTKKILLDEKWVAKIRDLSLSKTGPSTDAPLAGTFGYIDPEYVETARITEKSDVYSFGVVLFEVLCGQPAIDFNLPQKFLLRRALRCKKEGNLDQIIDPYLMGRINPWCLDKVAETAEKCVAIQGMDRPSMADVVSDLEYALLKVDSKEKTDVVDLECALLKVDGKEKTD